MSKPDYQHRDATPALREGSRGMEDALRDSIPYQPPGVPEEDAGSWLHAFDGWSHSVLRPWNPAARRGAARALSYQIGLNALLTAVIVAGWAGAHALRTAALAGVGMGAFVLAAGMLLVFVAGELGAGEAPGRFYGVAVDASCALVVMLLLLRTGHDLFALGAIGLFLVQLVTGLRTWAGFSRLRATAAVYLAIEVGMVGVVALGLGAVVALRA